MRMSESERFRSLGVISVGMAECGGMRTFPVDLRYGH